MNCYLDIGSCNHLHLGPMTSLYMGIPTLIPEYEANPQLSGSGYYEIIRPQKMNMQVTSHEMDIPGKRDIERSINNIYADYPACNETALKDE